MDDGKSKTNGKRSQISLSEREYWTDRWGISDEQLLEAIERTGSQEVDDIEEYLINHKYIV